MQPNRRNGFDFGMTIVYQVRKQDKAKVKRKELSLLFEDSDNLRAACELIEHLRKTLPSSSMSEDLISASVNPFADLDISPEDWQRVTERSVTKHFGKGMCIAVAGTPVSVLHQVSSGQVRVISHGAALDSGFATLGEGDFVGDADFVLMQPFNFTYIAETDVECLLLDVEHLILLFVKDAMFASRFFRFFAAGHANKE